MEEKKAQFIDVDYTPMDKREYEFSLLVKAAREHDWEAVCNLVTLQPEIMSIGLEYVYPQLPDEYKFIIPVECHTQNGDSMPTVRKYVRQARKYAPIEKRIPAEMIRQPEIVVYRAGEEPLSLAKYRISWTTDIEVAKWFYDRALARHQPKRHIYKGTIKPEKIIWYIDERGEKEVMQYNSISDIVELSRYFFR